MRTPFIVFLLLAVLFSPGLALAQDVPNPEPPKNVDVDVDVNRGETGVAWYKNPVIIGIAVIAVLLIAILASRGGTTIVERHQ